MAWPHKSLNFPKLTQRLGIVYCTNRPCFLYHVHLSLPGSTATQVPPFGPQGVLSHGLPSRPRPVSGYTAQCQASASGGTTPSGLDHLRPLQLSNLHCAPAAG